ncbi:hypothetical protein [Hymenobacter fodinae]|uniref:Uncharacterized protein n=1 Tax=Hymenobacter fodinae TaxID=2510796 RepID=A0A4Z0NZT5_9BACT|nr:hypothetical protein [Hymenobacter fodinae]TGE03847.1 hypothetical protein EU556_24890 [Hymenobacter fodinae]
MNIRALAHLEGKAIPCVGKITLRSLTYPTAYLIWYLASEQDVIAYKAAPLYFPYGEEEAHRLFEMVLAYIPTYRIGRKRVFTDVMVVL